MMDETRLRDAYDEFTSDQSRDGSQMSFDYIDGYCDGAYDFFEKLLGVPK